MRDTAESWLICAGSRQHVLRRILWRVQMVNKACVAQSELKHWSDQPVWQLSADCRGSAHLSYRSTAHFPHIRHIMNFWWKHELSADADAQTHVQKQVTRVHQVVLLKGSPSKQKTEVAGKKSRMTTWQHSPLYEGYVLRNTLWNTNTKWLCSSFIHSVS